MENLNLHSSGKKNLLRLLKEKYEILMMELRNHPRLSKAEKEAALKALKEKHKTERNNADHNVFLSD